MSLGSQKDQTEELEMLTELLECGGGSGVWHGNFTSEEIRILKRLEQQKLAAVMWHITAKGREELKRAKESKA